MRASTVCQPQSHQAFSHFLEFSRMGPRLLPPGLFACTVAFAWNALLSSASADYSLDLSSSRLPSPVPCPVSIPAPRLRTPWEVRVAGSSSLYHTRFSTCPLQMAPKC